MLIYMYCYAAWCTTPRIAGDGAPLGIPGQRTLRSSIARCSCRDQSAACELKWFDVAIGWNAAAVGAETDREVETATRTPRAPPIPTVSIALSTLAVALSALLLSPPSLAAVSARFFRFFHFFASFAYEQLVDWFHSPLDRLQKSFA